MPSAEVVELEEKLAAARQAETTTIGPVVTTPSGPDTSGMPGGVDSAPVNAEAQAAVQPAENVVAQVEQAAEVDAIDILQELRAGSSIAQVADKLLDQNGLKSIVKAIGDLAGKVF